GAAVTFILQNAPPFIALQVTGDSSARLILTPQVSDYGYYQSIKVVANASNGTSAFEYFNVYVTRGGLSDAIYLNFTDPAHAYTQSPWNNLNYSSAPNNQFNKLINNYGQPTGVSITMVNPWSGIADWGGDTYNNSGFVPDSVMASYYYLSDTATRTIQITGLDTTKRYNLVFFGSSYNETNTDYTTYYTVNGHSVSMNGISNTSNNVRINGIQPDSTGRIIVGVAKASTAAQGILNAMIIEAYSKGTIVSPANLSAVPNNGNVNLTWNDRSYNEQQFQIWRSKSLNGTYANIGNVSAGNTSYVDNNVAADTRYFYKVIATNASGSSLSSNIASVTTPQYAVYVNFDQDTPAPMPWNNLNTAPIAGNVFSFYDSKGNNSGITMVDMGGFSGTNPYGVNTGNNSGIYPDNVISNTFWVDANDTAKVSLQGLDLSKSYDLTFFGSRIANADRTTVYIANGQKVALQTANDSTQTVTLGNITPDGNGNINISVTAGGSSIYGYIGALVIQAHDNYDTSGNKIINPILYTRQKNGFGVSTSLHNPFADSSVNKFELVGNVYPNPFDQLINIRLNSPQDGMLFLTLYNSNGQAIDRWNQAVSAGSNNLQYSPKIDLVSGMYILSLRMESLNKVINVKLIKQSHE
ncbi:MAG: T9SS type A sorting domain-containing protein, partial [Nitrososphaerales archaeon]